MLAAVLRRTANIALWTLAVIGVVSGAVWFGSVLGLVKPLVVISGSMSPEINTGDMLIDLPQPANEVAVGQVVTLLSHQSGKFVTHRVVEVKTSTGRITLRLKGDANDVADAESYDLSTGEKVWAPWATIPGVGYVMANVMRPPVLIPGLAGLLALIGLSMLPRTPVRGSGGE